MVGWIPKILPRSNKYRYEVILEIESPLPVPVTTGVLKLLVKHISSALVRHMARTGESYEGMRVHIQSVKEKGP